MYWRRRSNDSLFAEAVLERDAEIALVRRYQRRGDTAARDELVGSHLRLVRRFAGYYARRGSTVDDLSQEGSLALLRAIETFAPDRGVRFATYAAFWIRARMQRTVAQWRSHQYATPASLAYATSSGKASDAGRRLRQVVSLDAPAHEDGGATHCDTIAGPSESVEQLVAGQESRSRLRVALAKVIRKLGDRRAVLICEQRMLCDEPATLQALGAELQLSREGVRLLELRLIRELKIALVGQTA